MIYHFFVKYLRSGWNSVADCVWGFLFSKQLALQTLNSFLKSRPIQWLYPFCNRDFSLAQWLQQVGASWAHSCWIAAGAPVSKWRVRTTSESHLSEEISMLPKYTAADMGYWIFAVEQKRNKTSRLFMKPGI